MNRLSNAAKTYIGAHAAVGAVVIWYALSRWEPQDDIRTAVYLVFAVLTSRLKVVLPGVRSSLSVNFLIILAAATTLNLGNTLVVALACTLTQCLWKPRTRPQPVQVAFNLAS